MPSAPPPNNGGCRSYRYGYLPRCSGCGEDAEPHDQVEDEHDKITEPKAQPASAVWRAAAGWLYCPRTLVPVAQMSPEVCAASLRRSRFRRVSMSSDRQPGSVK